MVGVSPGRVSTNGHGAAEDEGAGRSADGLPHELITLILKHFYDECRSEPSPHLPLPPQLRSQEGLEVYLATLRNVSLASSQLHELSLEWLWREIYVGMPRSWKALQAVVEAYAAPEDLPTPEPKSTDRVFPDILVGSRDKWSMLLNNPPSEAKASEKLASPGAPNRPSSTCPLTQTRLLSFSRFRTAGMGRSLAQGATERIITPEGLVRLLRETRVAQEVDVNDDEDDGGEGKTSLEAVGFAEYMDSSITRAVLEELLSRGGWIGEFEPEAELDGISARPSAPLPRRSFSAGFVNIIAEDDEGRQSAVEEEESRGRGRESEHRGREEETRGRADPRHAEVSFLQQAPDSRSPSTSARATSRGRQAMPPRIATAASSRAASSTRTGGRSRSRSRQRLQSPISESRATSLPMAARQVMQQARRVASGDDGRRNDSSESRSPGSPSRRRRGSVVGAGSVEEDRIYDYTLEGGSFWRSLKPVRALDLCGCVSRVFVAAVEEIVGDWGLKEGFTNVETEEEEDTSSSDSSSSDAGSVIEEERRLPRRIYFTSLQRLGLSTSLLAAPLLTAFVSSFPNLTHLDLTGTLATPLLLYLLARYGRRGLGRSERGQAFQKPMRLRCLSLAKCRLLTESCLVGFLCGECPPFTSASVAELAIHPYFGGAPLIAAAPGAAQANPAVSPLQRDQVRQSLTWGDGAVVEELQDLSLRGDAGSSLAVSQDGLIAILSRSPAILSGHLRTLDLSSAPLTDDMLLHQFPAQPNLLELGLGHCRQLSLAAIAEFLLKKAPSVEVLDLTSSCMAPPPANNPTVRPGIAGGPPMIRIPAVATPHLSIMGLHTTLLAPVASVNSADMFSDDPVAEVLKRKTNLHVLELDEATLKAIQFGAGDWKVIWGKGRRGWYIDTGVTSWPRQKHPNPSVIPHERPNYLSFLDRTSPERKELTRMVNAKGVVDGDIGWHTRKMEILRGHGMLGREEGLYAFHAFQTL